MNQSTASLLILAALAIGIALGAVGVRLTQTTCVDIWAYQRKLMEASDQRIPKSIQTTRGSMLYLALIMEELAEMLQPMERMLVRNLARNHVASDPALASSKLGMPTSWATLPGPREAVMTMEHVGRELSKSSSMLRKICARLQDDFNERARADEALELADGITDLTVVVAGFALAAGVPGPECYEEVVGSNLSKADPLTGKIHKDASGKWLKGPKFWKPNLSIILDEKGCAPPSANMPLV